VPEPTETVIDEFVLTEDTGAIRNPLAAFSSPRGESCNWSLRVKPVRGIAEMLFISPKTVETYPSRLMEKLGSGTSPKLVKFAIEHGLTSISTK